MRVGLNSLHQQDLRTTLYINQIEENAENAENSEDKIMRALRKRESNQKMISKSTNK